MDKAVKKYLDSGHTITQCPSICKTGDREKVNSKRPPPKKMKIEPPPPKPLHPLICQECQAENGKSDKRCLECKHYLRFTEDTDLRERIAFDHLPQAILENIADKYNGQDIISRLKSLPLSKSAPLLMQIVLDATVQEVADYHKITRQAVDKQNKLTIKILRTSLYNHPD